MKTRSIAAAFAVASLMTGFGVATASAAPPTQVVIHIIPNPFGNSSCAPFQCGAWDLTADSFGDSGRFRSFDFASSPPNRSFCASGPFREHFLLTSSAGKGALTVNAEEKLTGGCPNGVPNFVQTGVWQIEPGTGAYADASGHGDLTATFAGFVRLTLAGVISKTG